MDSEQYAEELRKTIRKLMNELTDNVALGNAQSFDQYQRMVGQIEGLAIAEREIISLQNTSDEDE
jgi:hypothetical protein|tara:strand:+ start:1058 stop:1252 length:195 start_codon:yes stop_codon:yes gene_type:complete